MEKLKVSPIEDPGPADRRRAAWRTRYALIGGAALVAAASLIVWRFWDGRGDVLKPDGGPTVTVMDFGRSFPLDPLPSGWKQRKFWTRTPMTMAFAVKDGVPSMRFETHDSAFGIVNLSSRGMLVVSVARRLGSGNSFARLLCCPAQAERGRKRRSASAKLTMRVTAHS
jgi:hypothetical protein